MGDHTSDPLFAVIVLVVTVFAAGAGLPLLPATVFTLVQTVLATRWLHRYGQGSAR